MHPCHPCDLTWYGFPFWRSIICFMIQPAALYCRRDLISAGTERAPTIVIVIDRHSRGSRSKNARWDASTSTLLGYPGNDLGNMWIFNLWTSTWLIFNFLCQGWKSFDTNLYQSQTQAYNLYLLHLRALRNRIYHELGWTHVKGINHLSTWEIFHLLYFIIPLCLFLKIGEPPSLFID